MERSDEDFENTKSGVIMQNNDYISILVQSLYKKIKILDSIIQLNIIQKEIIKEETFNAEKFEKSISDKSKLVEELNFLDTGFTEVYNRVKDDLTYNKDSYKTQIEEMKLLIQKITDKSVNIQVEEERIKGLVARKFTLLKQDVKKRRVSNKAVNEYYKKMSNTSYIDSQFVDKKK